MGVTQVPSATHDPFRDGFSGAAELATGLASTMTSQVSLDKLSDEGQSQCALSYKQSLSSTASTSLNRRWPEPVARDGHESLSQGPNVRTLYNGVSLEGMQEEPDVFDDAYAQAMADEPYREELAIPVTQPLNYRTSSRTTYSQTRSFTQDSQQRPFSQSTMNGQRPFSQDTNGGVI